jgi:molybdate transport system substrate-binding protein
MTAARAAMRSAAHIGLAALVLAGSAAAAAAADIRVYCTGAPARAVRAIAADFSARTGSRFAFIVGQPAKIERDLADGGKADVVIVPAPLIARLKQSGAVRADTVVDVARVGIGVVVRAGAAQPDTSSAAAIRKLLVDARSVVYPDPNTGGGSAGRQIEHMIEEMGLAETIKPKLTRIAAIRGGVDLVAKGKAEVGFFNISEILPIPGVTMVGPLPAELQSYIVFDAALASSAPEPAADLIKALAAPAARQAWQKAGLEPLGAAP